MDTDETQYKDSNYMKKNKELCKYCSYRVAVPSKNNDYCSEICRLLHLTLTKDINVEDKSKYFLSYLRNCGRDHRKVLAAYFQHNDLWDKNNLSFLKVCFANSNMGSITDYKLPKKYLKSFKELDSYQ